MENQIETCYGEISYHEILLYQTPSLELNVICSVPVKSNSVMSKCQSQLVSFHYFQLKLHWIGQTSIFIAESRSSFSRSCH